MTHLRRVPKAYSAVNLLSSILRSSVLLIFVLLSGCDLPLTEAQVQETAEAKLLQNLVHSLQVGDLQAVRMLLDAQTNSLPETEKAIAGSAEILPNESAKAVQFLNWWVNTDNTTGRTSGVSAHLEYPTRWFLVTAAFVGQPESMKVTGFQVQYAVKEQDKASPFMATASATGLTKMLNIASAWITVAVLLATVIACVLTRGLNRKWLWILFILFCTPGIYVQPATSTYLFNFIDFGWADGSWFQPQSGLHLLIPLGAVFFFLKLWNLRKPVTGNVAARG